MGLSELKIDRVEKYIELEFDLIRYVVYDRTKAFGNFLVLGQTVEPTYYKLK